MDISKRKDVANSKYESSNNKNKNKNNNIINSTINDNNKNEIEGKDIEIERGGRGREMEIKKRTTKSSPFSSLLSSSLSSLAIYFLITLFLPSFSFSSSSPFSFPPPFFSLAGATPPVSSSIRKDEEKIYAEEENSPSSRIEEDDIANSNNNNRKNNNNNNNSNNCNNSNNISNIDNSNNNNKNNAYKTKSGLKFLDLRRGNLESKSPRWGQAVIFHYRCYIRSPTDGRLMLVDSSYEHGKEGTPLVMKHGNGRLIRGIEEGMHSMKVGGYRRLIIPPSLSYQRSGLGPIPPNPFKRKMLVKELDRIDAVEKEKTELIAFTKNNNIVTNFDNSNNNNNNSEKNTDIIYDIELLSVYDDESDQGYYQDRTLKPEEVAQGQNKAINAIMLNQRREREEKEKQEGQLPIDKLKEGDLKGDIRGVQRSGL